MGHSNTFITGLRSLHRTNRARRRIRLGAVPSLRNHAFANGDFIAVSTGMLALWIYYKGLKTTPASVSTIVELAFPMTAVFIDFFLYDTVLTWGQYAAAAILMFAAYKVASRATQGAIEE